MRMEHEACEDSVNNDVEVGVRSDSDRAMEAMLPWVIAGVAHLGMIVLALVLVWSVIPEKDEAGQGKKMTWNMEKEKPTTPLSSSVKASLTQSQNVRKVETKEVTAADTLKDLSDLKTDTDYLKLLVPANGGGEKVPPFGQTEGVGVGIGEFYDLETGGAKRIVYLVDASGSLIDSLAFVIKELKRSIGELKASQRFTVIFFQSEGTLEPGPRGLKLATAENQRKISDWVSLDAGNVVPHGSSSPMNAIKRAMGYKPDLILMLSDNITGSGKYEVDRGALFGMLSRMNRDSSVRIHTIQFLYPDPLGTLASIARDHGGSHRFVAETDLGLE